jgi:hypothetical protein
VEDMRLTRQCHSRAEVEARMMHLQVPHCGEIADRAAHEAWQRIDNGSSPRHTGCPEFDICWRGGLILWMARAGRAVAGQRDRADERSQRGWPKGQAAYWPTPQVHLRHHTSAAQQRLESGETACCHSRLLGNDGLVV